MAPHVWVFAPDAAFAALQRFMPQAAPERGENEVMAKVLVRRPSLTGAVSPRERLVEGGLRNP